MFTIHRPTFDTAINHPHMRPLTFAVLPRQRQADVPRAADAKVPGLYRVCVPEDLPLGLAVFTAMTSFYLDVSVSDPEGYDFLYQDERTGRVTFFDEEAPVPGDLALAYMLTETSTVVRLSDLPD